MVDWRKYGVVYTPHKLAKFVSQLLIEEGNFSDMNESKVLDPACGEGALLDAMSACMGENGIYYGIDIDADIIEKNMRDFEGRVRFVSDDFILPKDTSDPVGYWKERIGAVHYIIANPPWSSDKLYEKEDLKKAGYILTEGQYDNYVLFIELCLKLVEENGVCAFILPDSIFGGENKRLRKKLCEEYSVCVIARLGEKLFKGVNRATSVLIVKKKRPDEETLTKCFRLSTNERKLFLQNKIELYDCYRKLMHKVKQSRFSETEEYLFDLDISESDEYLIKKIEKEKIEWKEIFHFGRGVEISKAGKVVICDQCNTAQGFTKKQEKDKFKKCVKCGKVISINHESVVQIISDKNIDEEMEKIYVGENLHRYRILGNRYIKWNVPGINYKEASFYKSPKILIRKTGLGIDASIDRKGTYISQTIYSCQYVDQDNKVPLEYYLALLNSRVIYYYYMKIYGENEWKSHPYFTKDIIFSLPIKKYTDNELTRQIISLAKSILLNYDRQIDLTLEEKIMELYELTEEEIAKIKEELSKLPDLNAINDMKF